MAQQNEEHFETIDKNKAKACEEQKSMRQELGAWSNVAYAYLPLITPLDFRNLSLVVLVWHVGPWQKCLFGITSNSFSFLSSLREVPACALCYNF